MWHNNYTKKEYNWILEKIIFKIKINLQIDLQAYLYNIKYQSQSWASVKLPA